jgi:hypothetical protein
MSEYAGRIAIGAFVAVAVAVGLGFELSNYIPNGSPSTSAIVSLTSSTGAFVCTGGSYRNSTWMLNYNLTDGRIHGLMSPCNPLDVQKGMGSLDVTSNPALPILLANGWSNAFYVNLTSGQVTQIPGVSFSPDYLQAFFNGQRIINGTVLANPYMSSSSVKNTPTCVYLNGDIHVAYPPVQSGPIFLKVVTDQGSLVKNGTVYASQRHSLSDWRGSGDYCLAMSYDTNPTGYMQIGDPADVMPGGDGLSLSTGVYNYTVIAQYGANQSIKVAIPDIVVQGNETTYITISIPSGEVTTVTLTCNQANVCTQSTSTGSAKGG